MTRVAVTGCRGQLLVRTLLKRSMEATNPQTMQKYFFSLSVTNKNIRNSSDPKFLDCMAYPLSAWNRFHLSYTCGDNTLRHFMTTGNTPMRIISVRPNPPNNEISIETESDSPQKTDAIIFDQLGQKYINEKLSLEGKTTLTLSIACLPAGIYHLMLGVSIWECFGGFCETALIV